MKFRQLFDLETSTYTYILGDEATGEAVIIDPVREQVDRDLKQVAEMGLHVRYSLETHVHADHITGGGLIRQRTGAKTVSSKHGGAACADILVNDGDTIQFGKYTLEVRATPGHTNGCVTYVEHSQGIAFTGDALLIRSSGRADFQQGDPHQLYRSVHEKIFTLPDHYTLYPGHDYQGRTATTVGEEKRFNPRLGGGKTEEEFVQIMNNLKLAYPKKIDVALPANLRCGLEASEIQEALPPHPSPWEDVRVSPAGVPEVTPEWVMQHGASVRLVDVREPDEYIGELGHIAGAELVPLAMVIAGAAEWDKRTPLITVCRSGGRSGKAAVELERMGFTQVASMAGGMIAWNARRYPVSRDATHTAR